MYTHTHTYIYLYTCIHTSKGSTRGLSGVAVNTGTAAVKSGDRVADPGACTALALAVAASATPTLVNTAFTTATFPTTAFTTIRRIYRGDFRDLGSRPISALGCSQI